MPNQINTSIEKILTFIEEGYYSIGTCPSCHKRHPLKPNPNPNLDAHGEHENYIIVEHRHFEGTCDGGGKVPLIVWR